MTVVLHAKEIRVGVAEGSINHLILKNFVDRYFSSVLKLRESFVIMHKESELSQKRYLIQWLYSACRKTRADIAPSFLRALQSAIAFPISVRVQGAPKPVQSLLVRVRVPQLSNAIFSLAIEPPDSLALNLFRFRFGKYLAQIEGARLDVETCEESLAILSDTLSRKRILAQPVVFQYDKLQIDRLYKTIAAESEAARQKQKFYRVVIEEDDRLGAAYRLLGATRNADAESLKRRYRDLARRCHPDRAFADGEMAVAEMTRKFAAINEAYDLIISSRT